MAVAVANGLMPMGLVFLRLAPEALQYLPLTPVTAAKLQGFKTNKIIVTLAAVAKLNDFCHRLHTVYGLHRHYIRRDLILKTISRKPSLGA